MSNDTSLRHETQVVSIEEYRKVCRERDEYQRKAEYYREKWAQADKRADGLHTRLRFEETIESAPTPKPKASQGGLKASEKQFICALNRVNIQKGDSERVYREDITRLTGMSPQTVSDVAAKMRDMGIIDYEYAPYRYVASDGEAKVDKVLFMRLNPEFKAAAEAGDLSHYNFPNIPRGLNRGKHFACKRCRSLSTKIVRQGLYEVFCEECGETHLYDPNDPKDTPFILDDETAARWERDYLQVPVEEEEQTPEFVESPDVIVIPADEEAPIPLRRPLVDWFDLDHPDVCDCGGVDFHKSLDKRHWICLDCGGQHPVSELREIA